MSSSFSPAIIKRYGNLFEKVIDFQNLHGAWQRAARSKRKKVYVNEFFASLEENLFQIKHELEAGAYTWGAYYTFEISDSKKRIISAPVFRDRVVHHAIGRVIEPIFDRNFIKNSFACRVGKGTLAGVRAYEKIINGHPELVYALKGDIQKYFPSIDHRILFSLIQRKIKDKKLLDLLESLIFTGQGKGIPIGNLTSQLFANIYLDKFDHYLKEDLRVHYYLRYMDDFVVMHQDKDYLQEVRKKGEEFLKEKLLLTLHPHKRHISKIDNGLTWLGYRVFQGYYQRVRTRNVVNFRRRLKRLEKAYRKGNIPILSVQASIASWFGLSRHANAFNLSRTVFAERDIRNLGKYFLCKALP